MAVFKFVLSLLAASAFCLGALECFSRNGIAANFVDIRGCWNKRPCYVTISELPAGLRFTFFTGFDGDKPFFVPSGHDKPAVVNSGEAIELQLAPDPDSGEYFHIGVNPAGELYTALKRDTSWEPKGLKVNTRDWRRVVIDIDYADLGRPKAPAGSFWRVNFCYSSRKKNKQAENFSWAGVKNFHDVKNYGILRFGAPPAGPVVILEAQEAGSARARVINGKGFQLEMLEDGKLWRSRTSSDNRWYFDYPEKFELYPRSLVPRTFRLKDRQGKIIWERSGYCGSDNRSILETDRYYYSFRNLGMTWKSSWKGKKEFFLSGPRDMKWTSDKNTGAVNLPEKEGRYLLTVRRGALSFSRVVIVNASPSRMAPGSGKWERQGEFLLCGGKRRFLLGGSGSKHYFNHHGPCFNLKNAKGETVPGALELAELRGRKLRRAADGTGYVFRGNEKAVLAFFGKNAIKLKSAPFQISRISYEAQMKSWLSDGGKLREVDPAGLYKKIYEQMKKYAPEQLFSLQIDRHDEIPRFAPICDVFEVALRSSYASVPLPYIADEIRALRKDVPGKVLIPWFGVTIPDLFSRSAEDLRAELYLAFINNCAGAILHLGHGILPAERSRLWSVISETGAELDGLMEEFHAHPRVAVKEPAGFQVALRDCGRYYLLVAVNCTGGSARLKLQLPGRGYFNASFAAFEPRVFRIKK